MATLDELRAENEAIADQMHAWKQQRFANGENPMDWVAFRNHVRELGVADPGETPPDEFYRWGEDMAGGQPTATAGTPPADQIEPTGAGGRAISEVNNLQGGPNALGDTSTWPGEAGSGSTTSHWAKPKTEH